MTDLAIAEIVHLRLAAMATNSGFVGGQPAAQNMLAYVSRVVPLAIAQCGHQTLVGPSGVRAHVTRWTEQECWYGAPTQFWLLDAQLKDQEALNWVLTNLRQSQECMNDSTDITLSSAYPELLQGALGLGLAIESIQLLGNVERGLRAMHQKVQDQPLPLDLEMRPLTVEQIPWVMKLKKRTFQQAPQYGWFGANPAFLANERQDLEQMSSEGLRFVLLRRGQLMGYCAASPEANPYWGSCAGIDLVFDKEIQGHGVVKAVYRNLLQKLSARGVLQFKGGTSQPAVIGLGRKMGRETLGWVLRSSSAFVPEHFGVNHQ